jgi:ElaB/YqjD/DUF883 family membrane-anchored ribosome-binding protein
MATDYDKAIDSLRADMKDLRGDLRAVVEAIKDSAREKVSDVRERSEERLHEAAENLRNAGKRARKRVAESLEENPLLTILAAIGMGSLVGGLFAWRRSR